MIPIFRSLGYASSRNGLLQSTGFLQSAAVSARFKHDLFAPPDKFKLYEMPEKSKLKVLNKFPNYPPTIRAPKMTKELRLMRGPEKVHTELIYKQFGIMAVGGGRLKHGTLEMIRMSVLRNLIPKRMFAIWRVDEPWQPVTAKGLGKRLGGGKGAIDHYVTPVKAGRIIMEIAGRCRAEEVRPWLSAIAAKLPCKAIFVDQKTILALRKLEELEEERNVNPYTLKYVVMNRMGFTQNWAKPIEKKYFFKYV